MKNINLIKIFLTTLVLASCATTNNQDVSKPLAIDAPAGLEKYYAQILVWDNCIDDDDFKCAEIEVPLDYENPDFKSITLALKKLEANKPPLKVGSLLINPGGPGGSGVDYVSYADQAFGQRLLDSFDIIGFDPRGVARSTPIDCLTDKEVDEFIAFDGTPDNDLEIQESIKLSENMAKGCAAIADNLIAHVGTKEAAQDMDVIRAVVGDEKLYYLGASYGTYLGGMYAQLFPNKVGRLVLDGAVDPSLSGEELGLDQAIGLDTALKRFVEDCPKHDDCPLTNTGAAGVVEIRNFLDSLDEKPLKTDDPNRDLTQSMAVYAVAGFLYDNTWWSYMRQSLETAIKGDGSDLLIMVDLFNDRNEDGTFASNSTEALYAINCFDTPSNVSIDEVKQMAKDWVIKAPIFGDYLAWGNLACNAWPVKDLAPITTFEANEAVPIIVVGTKFDPATPYKWAQGLSGQLASAVLLTYEGDGHTAYMRGSKCIDQVVEDYLIEGIVPQDGLTCPKI